MTGRELQSDSNFSFAGRSETWLSATFLLALVVLVIPLPTILLDMLLACNLSAAIILLLVTLGAKRPLDVSVFPSLLLLLTLFRLSLNVATTRLILLDANAGKIVHAFGDFVVGGNLIVGIVIFLILVTIQFIVITKGATRISEVNARFTLDAMPGKQMAIDAELNSGAINEAEARERRANLTREAEFYGAMDGASKYVRGDAIAGLVIMVVNILGGVMLGVSDGQSITDALQIYSILTIGDGLVTQIPALVIATSAGILVTKSASESSLGDEINLQITRGYRSLTIGAVIMMLLSLTPGFPATPFILIGCAIFFFVRRTSKKQEAAAAEAKQNRDSESDDAEQSLSPEEKSLEQFLQTDRIVLEIGAGLISLVEPKRGQGIAARIATMRADMAKQYGFWIPQTRICDNLSAGVNEYRILVCGREIGRAELVPDHYLAINNGSNTTKLSGRETRDPAFDLPAMWIDEGTKRRAEMIGYTVVDCAAVLITHLSEALRKHAHELLSREDLQRMLAKLKEIAPTTVEEIRADTIKPDTLHQVLVRLLAEGVPITSLEKIVESGIHFGPNHKNVTELTEKIRGSLGHLICEPFRNSNGQVQVFILEPRLEHHLRQSATDSTLALSPQALERLVKRLQESWDTCQLKNEKAALLVDSSIRFAVRQTIQRSLPNLSVVAYGEIPTDLLIDAKTVIQFEEIVNSADVAGEFDIASVSQNDSENSDRTDNNQTS